MGLFGETAKLAAELNLGGNFTTQLRGADRALGSFDTHLTKTADRGYRAGQQIGRGIQNSARLIAGATAIAATAIAGVGIKSLKIAGNFEAQLNTINTIARTNGQGLSAIGDGIRKVARDTGTSLDDLTSGYYDLLSAGVKAADAQNVLTKANTLAIGGLSTTGEAINLLTSAINTYGGNAKQAGVFTDVFAKAIERGKVTAAELAQSFSIIGPLAASSGISIQEIGAAFARLTSSGVPAAEAATQMRSALVALAKPTPDLEKLEKTTHKNYQAIAGKKGLVEALNQMRTDAAKAGTPLIDLFGRIEAVNFTLATTGSNFKSYNADLAAMGDAAGTAAGQMAERQKGLNFQLARLKALAKDAGISIGTALLPKLTPLLERLNSFIGSTGAQKAISDFGSKLGSLFSDANIKAGVDILKSGFETAKSAAPVIAAAARQTSEFVGGAVKAFLSLPKEIQAIAVGGFAINKLTGGLVTNIAGGIIETVGKQFFQRGSNPANPLFVSDVTRGGPDIVDKIVKGGIIATITDALAAALGSAAGIAALAAAPVTVALLAQNSGNPLVKGGSRGFLPGEAAKAAAEAQARIDARPSARLGKAADDLVIAAKIITAAGHDQSEAARFFHQTTAEAKKQSDHARAIDILGVKHKGEESHLGHIPQKTFIAKNTNSKAVEIADIFTNSFATGTSKYSRSTEKAAAALEVLKGLQRRLIARGDANSLKQASRVGKDIDTLRRVLHTDVHGTTRAINAKKTKIEIRNTIPVTATTVLNGRIIQSAFERYTHLRIGNGKFID